MKINRNDFINKLDNLLGKKFKDLSNDEYKYKLKDKGKLGKYIEEAYFGKELDNKSEPDFILVDIGKEEKVELKVTPVKKLKNGKYSAKERLVLNMIDYVKEVNLDFYESTFYSKCQNMAIIFYEYDSEKDAMDFNILKTDLHTFNETDLTVIKRDWNIIKSKIKEGKAHELSEGDTEYLGAVTKGSGKNKDWITQPFSDEKAKRRAFSLKTKYMTYYFNTLKGYNYDSISKNNEIKNKTIYEIIKNKLNPHYNKSINDLANFYDIKCEFDVNDKSKINRVLKKIITKALDVRDLKNIEEFLKSNTQIRTLTVKDNQKLKESSKICNLNLDELFNEEFINSNLYDNITKRTIYIIFNFHEGEYYLKELRLHIASNEMIDKFEILWNETKKRINDGLVIKGKKHGTTNNLPSIKEGFIGHIRPSATKGYNKNDKETIKYSMLLPDGRRITKQAFWYNNDYIEENVLK